MNNLWAMASVFFLLLNEISLVEIDQLKLSKLVFEEKSFYFEE